MMNCMLAGVGGQGTVLLSRLIGSAAIEKGMDVRGTETIGMAQRGGSVVSHVRMGENIHSPLIPEKEADLIIAFEPAEAVRALPFLKEEGAMIIIDRAIRPVSGALTQDYEPEAMIEYLKKHVKKLTVMEGELLLNKCGSAKVLNVALLGAAISKGLLPFHIADAEKVLKKRLPEKVLEMNRRALHIGAEREEHENDQ